MANSYFQFKQFTIQQDQCAMKVTTDSCLFGAWAAEKIKEEEIVFNNCLDIGTGTGILSLMLAQKKLTAKIYAIEIDADAAKQAQSNAEASPWKDRIFIMPGDAKDMPYTFEKEYDVIISNPPFYENELTSPVAQKNTAHHDSGLLLSDLLQVIKDRLHPEGCFYLLLPYKRLVEAGLLFQKYQLAIKHTTLVRQSPQHDPFRFFVAGQHINNSETIYKKDELIIKDDSGAYSPAFTHLLKDYYLYL
ncbi:MAG: methyltransferase [Bacteroidota bacterium]|nr:methyltransferase [Bacteroidota bacterium]